MTTIEVADAASRLGEVAAGVASHGDRVALVDGRTTVAVLVSERDLLALEETVELLSDREALQRIAAGEAAFQAGDVVAGSDLGQLDPGHHFGRPAKRPAD